MPKLGPYSRNAMLGKLDGRSREARLVKSLREELTAHCGGSPSPTQRLLIDQAASLQLHIALMDAKVSEGRELTPHDSRTYLAWCNSLSRLLRQLGLKATPPRPPTIEEHAARRERERAAAAAAAAAAQRVAA